MARSLLVCVVAVLLTSGFPSNALAQPASDRPTQSPVTTSLSSDDVLRLSLEWVDFLAVLADVRGLDSQDTDITQMLINNRLAANKLKSPLLLGGLQGETRYAKSSKEQEFIRGLNVFRTDKLAQAEKSFALLRRLSEATSEADLKTIPGDVAVLAGEADELWRRLPLLAALLAHILVDDARVVDDRTPYLRLTSQHIATLKQRLKQVFPNVGGTKGGFPLEVSASLLYEFLGSGYKAADGKRPDAESPRTEQSDRQVIGCALDNGPAIVSTVQLVPHS